MAEQVMNPLKCLFHPSTLTPDYATTEDFRGFVGYGLYKCWLGSDENDPNADCNMARPVTRDDVQELRIHFLNLLETIIASLWSKAYKSGHGDIEGDWESVTIAGENDNNPFTLTWYPRLDKDSVLFSLEGWGDAENIWLSYEAIKDRKNVLAVLTEARQTVAGWGNSVEVTSEIVKFAA